MVETISQKIIKARKEHSCSWCHGIIKVGEEYENSTLKTPDHGIYVWKNHMRCHELVDGLDMHMHGWDGICDDTFAECVHEYIQENNWFRDDVDMDIEGSLYKDEKLEDWMDEQDWGSTAIKAYEIFDNNKSDLQKYREEAMKNPEFKKEYNNLKLNHMSLMSDGSMQVGFTTEYSQEWPEEEALTREFLEKNRPTINIRDDNTLEDIDKFDWTDKKEDGE